MNANIPDALLLIDAREHAELTAARSESLNRVTRAERDLAYTLLTIYTQRHSLQSLSFVRPIEGSNGAPHAVEYTCRTVSRRRSIRARAGSITVPSESSLVPSSIIMASTRCASANQFDPLPLAHARPPFVLTLGNLSKLLWTPARERSELKKRSAAKPWQRSRGLSPFDSALMTASVALATLGGCLMGDAVVRDAALHSTIAAGMLSGVKAPILGGVLSGSVIALAGNW